MKNTVNYILIFAAFILAVYYWLYYFTPNSIPWEWGRVKMLMVFPAILLAELAQLVVTLLVTIPKCIMLQGDNLVKQGQYQAACKWYEHILGWDGPSLYTKIADLQDKMGLSAQSEWSRLQAERLNRTLRLKDFDFKTSVFYQLRWIPFVFFVFIGILYLYYQVPLLATIVLLIAVINAGLLGVFLFISRCVLSAQNKSGTEVN